MQQHPIPQNIASFEFKLIGDMTIKQFAYLAGFVVIAYLTFVSPLHPLIKFPLVFLFVLLGVALAFVPVEGRPLDRWITNFIRALFAPSQYIFHKEGRHDHVLQQTIPMATPRPVGVQPPPQSQPPRQTWQQPRQTRADEPSQTPRPTQQAPQPLPAAVPEKLTITYAPSYAPPAPTPNPIFNPSLVTPQPTANPDYEERLFKAGEKLEEENARLREELENIKKKLAEREVQASSAKAQPEQVMQEALAIEQRLQQALSEKERLAQELTLLHQQITRPAPQQTVVPGAQVVPKPSPQVKIIPPQFAKGAGFGALPHYPNIVGGVVKDTKGDILPNIIVEVKDQQGNPVRAFKTNKLGQFTASTPLANGDYTIELEDPKDAYHFDVIAIKLTGGFFQPLEIMAKDQEILKKQSERQQLHTALFGGSYGKSAN